MWLCRTLESRRPWLPQLIETPGCEGHFREGWPWCPGVFFSFFPSVAFGCNQELFTRPFASLTEDAKALRKYQCYRATAKRERIQAWIFSSEGSCEKIPLLTKPLNCS